MHNHTYLCGHAQLFKPQASHIIAYAQNFAGFSFCCHNPFRNPETSKKFRMPFSRYQEFLDEYEKAKQYVKDNNMNLDLILSMEVDYIPSDPQQTKDFVDLTGNYDSLNGSLHYYQYFVGNNSPDLEQQKIDFMYKYQKEFIDMIDTQWFTVISHLDFIKSVVGIDWWNSHKYIWYDLFIQIIDHLEQVNIQRIKEGKDMISLEINTSGANWDPQYVFMPSVEFITYIAKNCRHIPFCLSSDSHTPTEIGRNFKEALELLQKLNVKQLSYYKQKKIYFYSVSDALKSLNVMTEKDKEKYLQDHFDQSWIVPRSHIPYQIRY